MDTSSWTVERWLRLLAGVVVLVSLTLTVLVSHYWLWLTAFVGANLLQSAFTDWCPAMSLLRKLGVGGQQPAGRR